MCVKIMVIGAGQMGSGIAQVFAQNGYQVLLNDISTEYLDKSISNITGRLKKLVEKEKMTAETMAEILHHLEPTLDLTRAGEAALVMEAATENMEIKKKIFGKVEPILRRKPYWPQTPRRFPLRSWPAARNGRKK